MRLFVAMETPEAVRSALADLMWKLAPAAIGARWVRAEGMHLTLKFIGEVAPAKLEPLKHALTAVHSAGPVHLRFRGLGFFPNDRLPRVFWASVEATPNLAELAARTEAVLVPLGIPREDRAFHPHLTLARFNRAGPQMKLHDALRQLPAAEFGELRADAFHLFESRLKPAGAEYIRLCTFPFVTAEN